MKYDLARGMGVWRGMLKKALGINPFITLGVESDGSYSEEEDDKVIVI